MGGIPGWLDINSTGRQIVVSLLAEACVENLRTRVIRWIRIAHL